MPDYVNIGGVWRPESSKYVNIGGVWRSKANEYVNIAGVWRGSNKYTLSFYDTHPAYGWIRYENGTVNVRLTKENTNTFTHIKGLRISFDTLTADTSMTTDWYAYNSESYYANRVIHAENILYTAGYSWGRQTNTVTVPKGTSSVMIYIGRGPNQNLSAYVDMIIYSVKIGNDTITLG